MTEQLVKVTNNALYKIKETKEKVLVLPLSHKFYLAGGLFSVLIIVINAYFRSPILFNLWTYSLYISCSLGVLIELVQKGKAFYKVHKTIINIVIGILTFPMVKLSYTLAKHDIHSIVGLPPHHFSDSQHWLAIANGFMLIIAFIMLMFLVVYIISFVYIFSSGKAIVLARFIGGFGIAISLAIISSNIFESKTLKREIIALTDYYLNSQCDIDQSFRVAYLGDNKISVAYLRVSQWRFKEAKCKTEEVKS